MNFTVIFFMAGLLVYGAIVFWSGMRGLWWLAILLSLPSVMGGIMSLSIDMSGSSSPLFQNFGWVVIGQIIVGLLAYWAGSTKKTKTDNSKGFK